MLKIKELLFRIYNPRLHTSGLQIRKSGITGSNSSCKYRSMLYRNIAGKRKLIPILGLSAYARFYGAAGSPRYEGRKSSQRDAQG